MFRLDGSDNCCINYCIDVKRLVQDTPPIISDGWPSVRFEQDSKVQSYTDWTLTSSQVVARLRAVDFRSVVDLHRLTNCTVGIVIQESTCTSWYYFFSVDFQRLDFFFSLL